MAHTYDAIVIGTGQAGPSLAAELSAAGMRTAVIERHLFGGTCVNVGCIPTKALVASARAAHVARRAADFGVVIGGDVGVDMARVKARKDAIVRRSATGVERWMKSLANCTVYQGHGRFDGDHRVRVGGDVLEAERIFINVGARAFVPPFPGVEEVDYLTNSTIMELEEVPEHLVIAGGGYIGLEFAQMFRRFGSEVTLIDRGDRLIRRESEDVSAAVAAILEGEGVRLRLGAECLAFERRGDGGGGYPGMPRPGAGGGRLAPAAGGGPAPQHRRAGAGHHRYRRERARPHRSGRCPADQRAGRVGARRVQRARRLYPHRLQRLRDRRRQPAARRPAPGQRPHRLLRAVHRPAARPRGH